MNLKLSVWLGMPVVALVWADLSLWYVRRSLSQSPGALPVQEVSLMPSVLMPDTMIRRVSEQATNVSP